MLFLSKRKNKQGDLIPSQPVTQMLDEYLIMLVTPYTFYDNDVAESIPAGFTWDGATIFRIFYTFLGVCRFGYINPASLIHDYLYINKGVLPSGRTLSRREVDNLFIQHIIQLGIVTKPQSKKYALALRYGGYYFSSWKEKY